QAPEAGGWLRKEVKPRPHRVDKDYITALFISPNETSITLRAAPDGTGAGFGLVINDNPSRIRLLHTGDGELAPFDVLAGDATKLLQLQQKLVALVAELVPKKSALLDAKFNGVA